MQLVTALDPNGADPNNEAMHYQRAAKRVRDWRRDHDEMNQATFAELAQISVGCLQGFESGTRDTREKNLIKIAGVLGLTKEELLRADTLPTDYTDPRIKDLRDPDFRIANAYHHADAEVKTAMKAFFSAALADDFRERVALVFLHLLRLNEDHFLRAEQFVLGLAPDGTPRLAPPPASLPHQQKPTKASHKKSG